MTAPAFPVSQLGRPTVDYTLKPADLRVRTDTYSGLANSHNASNAGLTTISVKWEWGADNYAVFQDWFRNDCKDGSIEFTISEMYLFGNMGGITARFTEPYKSSHSAWSHYTVTAKLEVRTSDYIAESALDQQLESDSNTLLLLQVIDGSIVEKLSHKITITGDVIVSNTRTQDGHGSISNAAEGSTTPTGYLSVDAPMTLDGDFCIEGRWMPLVHDDVQTWLSAFPSPAQFQFQNWNGGLWWQGLYWGTDPEQITTPTLSAGTFHHVAYERVGSVCTLYIDGAVIGTQTKTGSMTISGIMLGKGPHETNVMSACCWEDFRISNIARYNGAFTPPDRFTKKVADVEIFPSDLFGNIQSDGYQENPQSSVLRGKTSGYARPSISRKSPITVTQLPVKWKMSQANKILFDAWYHYKLVDGAAWFWIYTEYQGKWQYIKSRFIETINLKYEKTDWWEISGTVETVPAYNPPYDTPSDAGFNYLARLDCPSLAVPEGVMIPIITDQPDDWTGSIGAKVTLNVVATTNAQSGPLTYQWYFGGVKIAGATAASYVITSMASGNEGNYYVVVSNDVGSVQSATAGVILAGKVTQFSSLTGADICQASNGNFYVVSNSGVYEVLPNGTYYLISSTAVGYGICQKSDGFLYVSGNVTFKLDISGTTTQFSSIGGLGICEGYNGLLYVTDFNTDNYSSAIWSINNDGSYQYFAGVEYYPYTPFCGICYDGSNFYVKNENNRLLAVISKTGSLITSNLAQVDGYSILLSYDGFLYVLSSNNNLKRVSKTGIVTDFSNATGNGFCEASDGNFYVVSNSGISKVTH